MPEYLSPGVYVEEIDTGSKPIEGVSTSTAGMVGVTERGPVNVPILITSFGEFNRWFGGYLNPADFPDTNNLRPLCYLPHAVEGFFTNGGKRVFVVRVLDATAFGTGALNTGGFARVTLDDRAATPQPLLYVQALDPGAWGNRLSVAIRDQDPPLLRTQIRNFNIATPTILELNSVSGIEVGTVLRRTDTASPPTPGSVREVKVAAVDRSNNRVTLVAPGLTAGVNNDPVQSVEFQMDVFLLRQPDPAVPSRNTQILDSESFRFLSMDARHSRYVETIIGTTWDSTAAVDDALPPRALRLDDRRSEGESRYVRVYDLGKDVVGAGQPDATLRSLRPGPANPTETLANGQTRPLRRPLINGSDMLAAINDATYIGIPGEPEPLRRIGLESLRNEEQISIVACPGRISPAIQGALINHCELMRYRFAVLDGSRPPADSLNDVQNQRQQFDTKYAALYHPWPLIPDPFPANLTEVADYPIPPSGHVIGLYARTDIERGVHKAPANEVLRGVIGLRRLLNQGEQDILNPYPVNINVIRDFRPNNRGIRVWGGRVITSDPDWKYVNVRRLLIFIEASIDRSLQWVVFEPNAEPLWARVHRTVSNFLTGVWRDGALEGTKPEEAYFVKVDRTTMTQTDIDNGKLIVVIGVAPVKPAEFVIIRIGLWTAHADA
jgi:uncharacterized protein